MDASRITYTPAAEIEAKPPGDFKVLVVDDDDRIVEALSTILSRDGYRLLSATDGQRAWDLVTLERPDLLVMDVLLPGIDGIELCRRIKHNSETHFSMVILMTGFTERSRRLDGLAVGADDFLKKPIDPLELTVRVRALLRTKQLYDEVEANRRELEQRVADRTRELKNANARLTELNQVKSNILAIVSHELRTPLMKVKSGLWLSNQEDLEQSQRAQVKQMMEDALNVLEYRITDIGIFSDPADLHIHPVLVSDLLSSAIEQIRILQPSEGYRVEVNVPKNLPPVNVDSTAISRVLAHLIDNGIKFGNNDPVTLAAKKSGEVIKVSVHDRGTGIEASVRERLFQPLEQGDDSTTRRHGGLGMGLALTKTILDAHRIPIEVESEVGVGTTVTLSLPVTQISTHESC